MIVHGGVHRLVDVTLADGSRRTATDRHAFRDARTGRFVYAVDLRPDDQVRTPSGGLFTGTAIRHYDRDVTAYNLTVDDIHTYYAAPPPSSSTTPAAATSSVAASATKCGSNPARCIPTDRARRTT